MRKTKVVWVLSVCLVLLVALGSLAAEQVTLTPKKASYYVAQGKAVDLRIDIAPRAARGRGVTYESDNPGVATVNARGRVSGVAIGECNIVVTSKFDESVSVKVPVSVICLAKTLTATLDGASVKVGEQKTLQLTFAPEETSVKEATFKSTNPRIATVDEKGVVTGVKAGKVAIIATAADGGNARGKLNLTVVQPVEGVSYKTPHVRVGVGYRSNLAATLAPKNATNKNMTWTSSDPSVATVTGTTNQFRIKGLRWGQTTITGVTQDGGYKVSLVADIGSLRHAVRVNKLTIRNDKPYITLKNASNMNITEIRYQINGFDSDGEPIQMSRNQVPLLGTYDYALGPGEYTDHGMFNFIKKIKYQGLYQYDFAITGFSTDTGYYNAQGELVYKYNISPQNYEWTSSD